MNGLDKRRIAVAGAAVALIAIASLPGPIANIRITRDATDTAISRVEATLDLGVVAFSFLRSWKQRSIR